MIEETTFFFPSKKKELMRLFVFLSFLPVVAGFVPRLVLIGNQHTHYADHYARFFRIPLIRPDTYITPKEYVVVADRAEDMGYLWDEKNLVVADMDRFFGGDGNRFISWVLQRYT